MNYIIHRASLFGKTILVCMLAIFVLNGCQKEQLSSSEDLLKPQSPQKIVNASKQGKLISVLDLPEPTFNLNKLSNRTATSRSANGGKIPSFIIDIAQEQRELLRRVINPDDYECGATILDGYFRENLGDFTEEELNLLFDFGSFIPVLEAAYIDDNKDKDFFGQDGCFTDAIRHTFVDLKTFWDIPYDIQLSDMHGTVFQNVPLVAELIQLAYVNIDDDGNASLIPDNEAIEFAQELSDLFGSDKFHNYNHPFFTFNAFAIYPPPGSGLPKKIVMGDGIMEVYAQLGLGSMAERFILAHEYGHQIHFDKDLFGDDTPESTRFLELLSDTYASYYASHGQGLFLHPLLVNRYIKTSSSVGDCAFDSPGHHGTPNQRGGAADLGGELARKVGLFDSKYSSDEVLSFFIDAFPELIQPDAE